MCLALLVFFLPKTPRSDVLALPLSDFRVGAPRSGVLALPLSLPFDLLGRQVRAPRLLALPLSPPLSDFRVGEPRSGVLAPPLSDFRVGEPRSVVLALPLSLPFDLLGRHISYSLAHNSPQRKLNIWTAGKSKPEVL
jgi:hypothetical protein